MRHLRAEEEIYKNLVYSIFLVCFYILYFIFFLPNFLKKEGNDVCTPYGVQSPILYKGLDLTLNGRFR